MKTIEDFEPFVLAYVPTAPQEIIQHAIRESIVEFMRETKVASASVEIKTQERVNDYIIDVPDCRRIVKIKKVYQGRSSCGNIGWNELYGGEDGEYRVELRAGGHPIIILKDAPRKPTKLRLEYVWTIGRDDCDVPDFIYDDYMSGIVAGALIRLATFAGNENIIQQISMHQMTWYNAVQQAKIDKTGGKARRIIGSPMLSRRGGKRWL